MPDDRAAQQTLPESEVSGFSFVEDDAAYRIRCDKCGATSGTLGRSEDYACGWLDAWAEDHLEECAVATCNHLRSVTRDGYRKWCNDCRSPLPLAETEATALQEQVEKLRTRIAYIDKWADLLDTIPGETFSAETIAVALRSGRLPRVTS